MIVSRSYSGGEYLDQGHRAIPGSVLDGTDPIFLAASRSNTTLYSPELVLVPDEISDAAGRFASFCLDGYPVWGYRAVEESRVADMGVGAGNFVVSLLDGLKQPSDKTIDIDAIDLSVEALATARINIENSVKNLPRPSEVTYKLGDYAQAVTGVYDVIYFNPPYLEKDHNITHTEASLAPHLALYSDSSTDEYERVVPHIRDSLTAKGIALVRLPKEDTKVDEWLKELLQDDKNANEVAVIAKKSGRIGRLLLISGAEFPDALGEYDYFMNYLGGKERREKANNQRVPIYHDLDCEIDLIREGG